MQRSHPLDGKLSERAARFATHSAQPEQSSDRISKIARPQCTNQSKCSEDEFNQQLIGTCELLEKCYLRLTSAPKESDIRPKHVLVKSLERVKSIWAESHDYNRVSELLKSIRQDMTVQGIRDEFSVEVYETHARFALHALDHPEFNICLSALKCLYVDVSPIPSNKHEFTAYRLLYYLFTKEFADLSALLSELVLNKMMDKSDYIQRSIQIVLAWHIGSYRKFFMLYQLAPVQLARVMDLFILRERITYFNILMKAYRPTVPIAFMTSELGFADDRETSSFLAELKCVAFTDSSKTVIDCRVTFCNLSI